MFVTMDRGRTEILEDTAVKYGIPPDDLEKAYEAMLENYFVQDIEVLAESMQEQYA